MKNGKLNGTLTEKVLTRFLTWGDHLSKTESYGWTQHDLNAYHIVQDEIKKMLHEKYLRQKERLQQRKIESKSIKQKFTYANRK